ncbi:MAG: HAMP domain-containing protein [Gammaproteobacteria bacterium]|nr:HAMP domain-containing protein [Gammaproteobacteria bacterium]NNJ50335.1 HAMP domain-containing protein [Gammaproteobacteria bacterium]
MKLGTRLLVFSSIFLVTLPLLGYYFIEKIERSLLQGQQEVQSMTASALATVVKGYTDLFDVEEDAIYVYPKKKNISIDGYIIEDEDWYKLKDKFTVYKDSYLSSLLTEDARYIYVFLKVKDRDIIYRNPRYASLDSSDHIRLEYLDKDGQRRRLVMLTEGQGNISVYEAGDEWKTWKNGRHISAVYGVWRETSAGYDVELRFPSEWLGSDRRLSISVVDVFGENERYPDTIVSTQLLGNQILNPLLFHSRKIGDAIAGLKDSSSQICVIDKYRRVRAVIGGQQMNDSLCQATDKVSKALVENVLKGEEQLETISKGDEVLIVAAHPVFDASDTIGAVLVGSSSKQILARQRVTLNEVILATAGMVALVFISLLIFSSWLAYRINRLKKQAASLVDDSGRIIDNINLPDSRHRDEIGELSRSFTALLDRLNDYTSFLETVPRMLRHEILNPVNTISMSLQSLQGKSDLSDNDETGDITTAGNAIQQLQLIVSSLTEAANIDDALTQDETETFDIAALLDEYVSNSRRKHHDADLQYHGINRGVFVEGNDIRMVQLLDKIKDNALDFATPETGIVFELDISQGDRAIIYIKNEGDSIPQQQLDMLFQGMVSHRSVKTGMPHLGIGLYVAHKIAQFHQGQLKIANRRDKQGVEVVLVLPTVKNR